MKITVAIPTFERPDWLKEALESCFNQTILPDQIIIGDDSRNDETEQFVETLKTSAPVPIYYKHHKPSLKQSGNMNWLIESTDTSHFMLLHDDDLLLPNAIETLSQRMQKQPEIDIIFGNQSIISEEGEALPEVYSEDLNATYGRTASNTGLQENGLAVCIQQMFPNDGYLLKTEIIKDIPWKPKSEVGNGCEFDFSLRLGLKNPKHYYTNTYVCKYRINPNSMGQSNTADSGIQAFRILKSTAVPTELSSIKKQNLERLSPIAISQAISHKSMKEAWNIYCSEYHPWTFRLSAGGIKRLVRLLIRK